MHWEVIVSIRERGMMIKYLPSLEKRRGKHFDPTLIDIFFDHLDEFLAIRDRLKDTI